MKTNLLRFAFLVLLAATMPLGAGEEQKEAEPTLHQKAYYFEHRLLPKWTHNTKGEFFRDLQSGALDRLKGAATEIVGSEFAQKLGVRALPGSNRVLITFPEPGEPPLCFFVLIEQRGESFRFFTLEISQDVMGDGTKSAFCEWDKQGGHKNLGPRKYTDEEHFLADIPKD